MPAITSVREIQNDSFIISEANALPTKRLFDFNSFKLRESTKLAKEFELSNTINNELIFKVKMVGVNYQTDFQTLKRIQHLSHAQPPAEAVSALVPGNKIIGKIHATTTHPSLNSFKESSASLNAKYLLFPYTNCINQNRSSMCTNCQKLVELPLSYKSYKFHHKYPCKENLIYGTTIDGGLQDFLKVPNPDQTLIRIPLYVSLHDSCFILDIMLPFYSFIKDNLMDNIAGKTVSSDDANFGGILIVLNDISKEINDILIVIKHFQIDQKSVSFLDRRKIEKMPEAERLNYKGKFSQVFLFHISDETIKFATYSCNSPGLESTKSRYNIVLFDQHNPESLGRNKFLNKLHNDKTFHQFKLSYKDRINAEELLKIISSLNRKLKKSEPKECSSLTLNDHPNRPSIGSIESNGSTFSGHTSAHSDSTSSTTVSSKAEEKPVKNLRFRDEESIIDESTIRKVQSSPRHYSWLWYDKDYDLCNEYEQSDDEEDPYRDSFSKKNHSVKQVNRLIKNPKHLTRVCYANRSKPIKLNALVFS
ncbi:uncharacterized protein CANTADRAFT_3510 [Suhomyces tanzawaensis NRRL Y-17324]|uniref:Uncharacterized protein n=1 Tax=Suhomyces tanzawaensis NRRL Y-17324 TaxID=984487 RepID=A0A1E4SPQ6_9ASCO|nr:uncharacterized protein CANTADRAFT_3510 [Suhomyces tanzawaensis NRRL Y-17324]ODV81397.1 hypothetical protein CANTADRAFT_3510 [Suhomyces tanzawaensis NRRL Y-17324]